MTEQTGGKEFQKSIINFKNWREKMEPTKMNELKETMTNKELPVDERIKALDPDPDRSVSGEDQWPGIQSVCKEGCWYVQGITHIV